MPGEFWRVEDFADREQVGGASDSQRNEEGRCAETAEIPGAEGKRDEQDSPKNVQPAGRAKPHSFLLEGVSWTMLLSILPATLPCAAPGQDRASIRQPVATDRRRYRCRRKSP